MNSTEEKIVTWYQRKNYASLYYPMALILTIVQYITKDFAKVGEIIFDNETHRYLSDIEWINYIGVNQNKWQHCGNCGSDNIELTTNNIGCSTFCGFCGFDNDANYYPRYEYTLNINKIYPLKNNNNGKQIIIDAQKIMDRGLWIGLAISTKSIKYKCDDHCKCLCCDEVIKDGSRVAVTRLFNPNNYSHARFSFGIICHTKSVYATVRMEDEYWYNADYDTLTQHLLIDDNKPLQNGSIVKIQIESTKLVFNVIKNDVLLFDAIEFTIPRGKYRLDVIRPIKYTLDVSLTNFVQIA